MTSSSILLRQVHPSFVQADTVSAQAFTATSQAFRPTEKDSGYLSMYNNEKFTAEESYEHYTTKLNCKSFGVLGITGDECEQQQLKWAEDNNPFDGHSYVDFNGLKNSEIQAKAKLLKNIALKRGWLFREQ